MRLTAPVLLVLLSASTSRATLLSRSASFVSRAASNAHHNLAKRSSGLARDIRTVIGGLLVEQRNSVDPATAANRAVYCIANNNLAPGSGSNSSGEGGNSNTGTSRIPQGTSSAPPPNQSNSTSVPPSNWKLVQEYSGNSFFNGWDFWDTADPTHGTVNYLSQGAAQAANLSGINAAGNAFMKVETTPTVSANRQSVRITTTQSWNGGLFLMDSVHMPTGCATWPAFWTNGPNWPQGGEIDIVEGVNDYTNNQATIHTNPGCSLGTTSSAALSISGSLVASTDCAAASTGNQGCGMRSNSDVSFGPGFNANGGGVYAMQWDDSGIATYFFPRGSIPNDITAGQPQPSNWGLAESRWPAANCDPFEFFYDHVVIFDTTLCGDWASGVWGSAGLPGQEQSCAQRTGYSTCEAFVQKSGSSFVDAYWEVQYVKVFQTPSN